MFTAPSAALCALLVHQRHMFILPKQMRKGMESIHRIYKYIKSIHLHVSCISHPKNHDKGLYSCFSFVYSESTSAVALLHHIRSSPRPAAEGPTVGQIGRTPSRTFRVPSTMISHSARCNRPSYASNGSSFLISTSRTTTGSPRSTSLTTRCTIAPTVSTSPF